MKNLFILLIALCYFSCKTNKIPTEVSPRKFNNEKQLIAYVDSVFTQSKVPGLSYTVLDEDGPLFERSFGYSDIDAKKKFTKETILNIASISKTVIAVAMMKAVEEGFVSLDEDINSYLPFEVKNPKHPNSKITLRQLATHSSSIIDTEVYDKAYYFYDAHKIKAADLREEHAEYLELVKENKLIDDAEFLKNVLSKDGSWYDKSIFSEKAPGADYQYSNIAASLAAYVIECATKTKYEDYTAQKIFDPLDMRSTTWTIDEQSRSRFTNRYFDMNTIVPPYYLITKADGGLYTSVSDFSKYMQEMIRGSQGNGTILSDEGYDTMLSIQIQREDNHDGGIFWELPYGKGFAHDGSDPGVTTRTSYNRERRRCLIFFCNVSATAESFEGIEKIWEAVALYNWK